MHCSNTVVIKYFLPVLCSTEDSSPSFSAFCFLLFPSDPPPPMGGLRVGGRGGVSKMEEGKFQALKGHNAEIRSEQGNL